MGGTNKIKVGDLVQVLPAKIGYYIVLNKIDNPSWQVYGSQSYWNLQALPGGHNYFTFDGPMSDEFIEVVNESR